ncbi:MAG: bifunctional glutamate N-acetyltransferase/amino-acid acetyltransferase ArgJ [Deltaproteobacteria bacterium]|nr:bifunctional glutamate N-acetyltransferase/amino-acid acetyltransferase ArgJ [Deltaproteobacteria bacterium]
MKLDVVETPVAVPGFLFAGVACGIKASGRPDLALIVSDVPAVAAGVVTRNRVKAAPVRIVMERLERGRAQAVVINSGNANACTGAAGMKVARDACAHVAAGLGIDASAVLPCSTGKIGVVLPAAPMRKGVAAALAALDDGGFWRAARAIMTTDAFPKAGARRVRVGGRTVTIAAMAKGAGMIAPDMATLLVTVVTDAAIAAPALRTFVREAVATSFNAITVDGDCSTNDTVLMLANGVAGNARFAPASPDGRRFQRALTGLLEALADMVVADGEGATKRMRITVAGARTAADARRAARAIGESQLVKTALFGGDPNWGRIACAAGYAGVPLDADRLSVTIAGVRVLRRGVPEAPAVVARAARGMRGGAVDVTVDLAAGGHGAATLVASDLTPAYVKFNSDYST